VQAGMSSSVQSLTIIVKSSAITLWISVRTLFEVYAGRFTRDLGDRRLRWWSSRLLRYVGVDYRVHNPGGFAFTPGTPYIVMCNHRSLYDIPLTFIALHGSIRMLTKKELFRVPIWGRGMRAGEFISIDRQNRQQAFRDLDAAKEKMESGIVLWVAPEGTRSRTGELLPFKKGPFRLAFETKAVIVPLGIHGSERILPAKSLRVARGERVDVRIGTPIDSTGYGDDLAALMADVRAQIAALGGYVSDAATADAARHKAD
jgi:1-acyl-sn-glycerol-3-phosphate acyltransferase